MDCVTKFTADSHKNTGILVFVDQFIKLVHHADVPGRSKQLAVAHFGIFTVYRLHVSPVN